MLAGIRHHGDFVPRPVLPVAFGLGGAAGCRAHRTRAAGRVLRPRWVDGDRHRVIKSEGAGRQRRSFGPAGSARQLPQSHLRHHLCLHGHPRRGAGFTTSWARTTLYRIDGDSQDPDPIMTPHDTWDPTLRRALEHREVAVNEEPVKEAVRSYMSAYAPVLRPSERRFVGVVGSGHVGCATSTRASARFRRAGIGAFIAVAMLSVLAGFVVYRPQPHGIEGAGAATGSFRRGWLTRKQQAEVQGAARRSGVEGQERFSRDDESRDPHAHERCAGFRRSPARDAAQRRACGISSKSMRHSGDALLAIINDVLDYSKIEAGKMSVEKIDFDLRTVCEEVRADSAGGGRGAGTGHDSRVTTRRCRSSSRETQAACVRSC